MVFSKKNGRSGNDGHAAVREESESKIEADSEPAVSFTIATNLNSELASLARVLADTVGWLMDIWVATDDVTV